MKVMVLGTRVLEGFTSHIAETLQAMGHDAFECDVLPLSEAARSGSRTAAAVQLVFRQLRRTDLGLSRRLVKGVFEAAEAAAPLDLVLSVHDYLKPAEVGELKRLTRAKVALWFPDPVAAIGRAYFLASPYDAVFLKDPYMVSLYRRQLAGAYFYMPEAFNPERHRAVDLSSEERTELGCDVCFLGNADSQRIELARRLADYDLKLWGPAPPRWMSREGLEKAIQNRFVAYDVKSKVLLAAKIVVNTFRSAEIWGTNVKTFEIAGVGAFQLCEWRPIVPHLFRPGEEIETYRSFLELREKIDRYRQDDDGRARISEAGRRRALADHTYERRLARILETVFDGGTGWPAPPFEGLG